MLKRKFINVLAVTLLVSVLGACSNTPAVTTTPDENIETITGTDSIGRTVEVPE